MYYYHAEIIVSIRSDIIYSVNKIVFNIRDSVEFVNLIPTDEQLANRAKELIVANNYKSLGEVITVNSIKSITSKINTISTNDFNVSYPEVSDNYYLVEPVTSSITP